MRNIDIVTGTGSCGTTFFIEFLSKLGLTYVNNLYYNHEVRGGYEYPLSHFSKIIPQHIPNIIKDPRLMFGDLSKYYKVLKYDCSIEIQNVFLCFRSFDQAAKSRSSRGILQVEWGDIKGKGQNDYEKHIDFYQQCLAQFILEITKLDLNLIVVDYERMNNPIYLFNKINKIYPNVTLEDVTKAHKETYISSYKNTY